MKDKENLSVEEILREADEMLNQISARSKSAAEYKEKEEVKTFAPKSSSIDISSRSDAVSDKTRAVTISDKTKAIPVTDKTIVNEKVTTKHFFQRNPVDDDYNAQPPQIIERPATIKSKSRFNKTSDLQEIPTILAVEELAKTRTDLFGRQEEESNDSETDYDLSDQIKLNGFDDEFDEIPNIDEEVAEEQLRQRREDKINKFRLFAKEEAEGGQIDEGNRIVAQRASDDTNRTKMMSQLFKHKSSYQLECAVTLALGILLGALAAFQNSYNLPYFLSNTNGFYITMLALYVFVILTNIKTLVHGFNFKRGINADFPVSFASLIVMAHTATLLANPDTAPGIGAAYPPAIAFALVLTLLGKRSMVMRIINDYDFLSDGKDKYSVEDIVNEVDATIISRNLLSGDPLLKYSVKTDMPTSFLEISCSYEPTDRIARILTPVMIVLNTVLFGLVSYLQKDWFYAFNVAAAGVVISCPVVSLLATNYSLLGISRSLTKKGAVVNGFEGAHVAHKSNALVMEASDLFGNHSCDLHGIRLFNKTKVDDALLLTAAVIMKTKSPLKHVFDDVIVGKQAILPEVDTVIYEDKMGTSAWIYQKKVLVGNRDLLIRHGISVPKEDYENKYATNGRKALYLAVAGKIAAMFVVSYSADSALKKELKKLEKSGITILLKSCDPYINEESIMEIFGLPEGFVRVLTASNARVFEKYSDIVVEKSPAYVVHNGSALGFISAVRGSENLISTESMLSVLVAFGSAIGFGIVALLGVLSGINQLNVLNVIIFQLVWSIFVLIISKIRRNGI
ncbi:MAG: hypothetical protein K2I73_05880 [Eubacterium sp.]|nr:hypothetical protein [Eubacterium sp.]